MKQMTFEDVKLLIGKKVSAVMDRPMGSRHPKWGFMYPCNYGNIPNTVAGDGEELDVYILGEYRPVEKYEGIVRAVIHRLDDDDDKLVIFAEGKDFSVEQIYALTEFHESAFKSDIYFEQNGKIVKKVLHR